MSRTWSDACARIAPGQRPSDSPRPSIVREATLEIRSSIVFATVIIVLVFLPMFGLAGVEGRLLTPLAFAYIVALLASLAVAIVVTPALCFAFLPHAASIERGHDGLAGSAAEGAVRPRRCRPRSIDPIVDASPSRRSAVGRARRD